MKKIKILINLVNDDTQAVLKANSVYDFIQEKDYYRVYYPYSPAYTMFPLEYEGKLFELINVDEEKPKKIDNKSESITPKTVSNDLKDKIKTDKK